MMLYHRPLVLEVRVLFGCLDHECDLNRERASVAIFWTSFDHGYDLEREHFSSKYGSGVSG